MRALLIAAAATALAWPALANPLPDAGPLALDVFFDGCLNAVGSRHDPGPSMEKAIAAERHDPAVLPDPQHPEHKLWKVRGVDGDVELETFNGKAWCEVRLIGADGDAMARRLNLAIGKLDVPMQRRSMPADAPGVTTEAVILGHDMSDGFIVMVRKVRQPKDGEPGLTLSAGPVRETGQEK